MKHGSSGAFSGGCVIFSHILSSSSYLNGVNDVLTGLIQLCQIVQDYVLCTKLVHRVSTL